MVGCPLIVFIGESRLIDSLCQVVDDQLECFVLGSASHLGVVDVFHHFFIPGHTAVYAVQLVIVVASYPAGFGYQTGTYLFVHSGHFRHVLNHIVALEDVVVIPSPIGVNAVVLNRLGAFQHADEEPVRVAVHLAAHDLGPHICRIGI